jgi:peptidoglycan/LPS O-acetylase OafA/YrhL
MEALASSPLIFLAIIGTMGITATALLKARLTLLAANSPSKTEYVSIAGLRGLLAASVFVHHAQVSRIFFRDGMWTELQSTFYSFAGTGSVGVFFMITGFLFWGKALDGKIRFLPLLKSRVRRILPLYILSFLIIFAICLYESNFSISVSWSDLGLSIAQWLGGGLFGAPDINGVGTLTINCGVTWTLQYEWIFYLALPLIVVFSPPRQFILLIGAFLIVLLGLRKFGYLLAYHQLLVAVPFFGGMLSAYAVRYRSGIKPTRPRLASVFVVASFVIGAFAYRPGYFTLVAIALFPAFTVIALGNDVFGLLRLRWVRYLGEISFSVYLLHGIILMTVLSAVNRFAPVGRIPYYGFVLICVGLSALIVLASTVTFILVERRFMKVGARWPLQNPPTLAGSNSPT